MRSPLLCNIVVFAAAAADGAARIANARAKAQSVLFFSFFLLVFYSHLALCDAPLKPRRLQGLLALAPDARYSSRSAACGSALANFRFLQISRPDRQN